MRALLMATSIMLDYPTERTKELLPTITAELSQHDSTAARALTKLCAWVQDTDLISLQEHYVRIFDQKRRCALGLTYYTHGDTRMRGQALARMREILQAAGFELVRGELPDHLPMLLEFAALDDTEIAVDLLSANYQGLAVLQAALEKFSSPYALALEATLALLPEPTEAAKAAFTRLIQQGPPTELVGIGDLTATPLPLTVST